MLDFLVIFSLLTYGMLKSKKVSFGDSMFPKFFFFDTSATPPLGNFKTSTPYSSVCKHNFQRNCPFSIKIVIEFQFFTSKNQLHIGVVLMARHGPRWAQVDSTGTAPRYLQSHDAIV